MSDTLFIKIFFAIIFSVIAIFTMAAAFINTGHEIKGMQMLTKKRIIFKFSKDNKVFIFRTKQMLFMNKKQLTSEELLALNKGDDQFEIHFRGFISNLNRNEVLFASAAFDIDIVDPRSHSIVPYMIVFKHKKDGHVYGEFIRKTFKEEQKIKNASQDIRISYKEFETTLLSIASKSPDEHVYSYTISLSGIDDLIKTTDEHKSKVVAYKLYNNLAKLFEEDKKISFYVDASNRFNVAVIAPSEESFKKHKDKMKKILTRGIELHYTRLYVNGVIGESAFDGSLNPAEIRKLILKNLFSINKARSAKVKMYKFKHIDEPEFDKYISQITSLNKILREDSSSVGFRPFLHLDGNKIIGYEGIIRPDDELFDSYYDAYQVSKDVQMSEPLFRHATSEMIRQFFSSQTNEYTLLFLGVPIRLVDSFLSMQDVLMKELKYDAQRVVANLFDYENVSKEEIKKSAKLLKDSGYKIGYRSIGKTDLQTTLEATEPTFFTLSREITSSLIVNADNFAWLKALKKQCLDLDAYIISPEPQSKERLEVLMRADVDIVCGNTIHDINSDENKKIKKDTIAIVESLQTKLNHKR